MKHDQGNVKVKNWLMRCVLACDMKGKRMSGAHSGWLNQIKIHHNLLLRSTYLNYSDGINNESG